jgi:peptidoglycan hydrolase CwlO-like protein
VLCIGLACSGTTPNAVQELEQAYTRNEHHIEEQREKQSKVLNELLTIYRNLKVKQTELTRLNANLKAYQHEQINIQQQVADAHTEFQNVQHHFERRIRDIYKYQNFGFLEVLFSSHDLLSFFETAIWFEKLLTADIRLLDNIQKKHQAWLNYQRKIAQRKSRIESMQSQAQSTLLNIQQTKQQKNQRLQTLNQTIEAFEKENQALLASSWAGYPPVLDTAPTPYSNGAFFMLELTLLPLLVEKLLPLTGELSSFLDGGAVTAKRQFWIMATTSPPSMLTNPELWLKKGSKLKKAS